jgi:hypothetical protein
MTYKEAIKQKAKYKSTFIEGEITFKIFVTTITLGCLLIACALLWAWINLEEGAHALFTAVPTIVTFALTILLWLSRSGAKEILYPKKE